MTASTVAGPSSRESVEAYGLSPCTVHPPGSLAATRLTDSWPGRPDQLTSTTLPGRGVNHGQASTTSPSRSAGTIDGPRTTTLRGNHRPILATDHLQLLP